MQLRLIQEIYYCLSCGRDVAELRRVRRFRICPACWQALRLDDIMDVRIGPEDRERQRVATELWGWYYHMEQTHPLPPKRYHSKAAQEDAGAFFPYCAKCGQETPEYGFDGRRSLFGGPRHRLCPRCDAIDAVERVYAHSAAFHPGWDDEDWLELLSHSHPEAFRLDVLPGYWFELKLRAIGGKDAV
jgi:hypothetical protein